MALMNRDRTNHGLSDFFGWMMDLLQAPLLKPPQPAHEFHTPTTKDGHDLGLWRYPPRHRAVGEPVLLVHGLSLNHRIFTIPLETSLVSVLRRAGYDCWAVDLRGRTMDESPEGIWGFDHYAKYDLPATMDHVFKHSDYDRVHWVGLSMGGMLYYAVAGALGYQDHIATGIPIGSPVRFHEPGVIDYLGSFVHGLPFALKRMHVTRLLPLAWYTMEFLPRFLHTPLINTSNVSDRALRTFCAHCLASGNSRVVTQFPDWFVRDEWVHRDGEPNYREGLKDITVPTKVIIGDIDPLCPDAGRAGFELLRSEEKELLKVGEGDRYENHFSHVDLVLGEGAYKHVYPEIRDWLKSHPIR